MNTISVAAEKCLFKSEITKMGVSKKRNNVSKFGKDILFINL